MDHHDEHIHEQPPQTTTTMQSPSHPLASPPVQSSSFATISSAATTTTTTSNAGGGGNPHRTGGTVKMAAGYILRERLGSGSFATVYRGVRPSTATSGSGGGNNGGGGGSMDTNDADVVVAIKAISRSSKKLTKKVLENLEMEISILRTYHHRNIVGLHEVQKTDRHFYLVLEYCGGGDLQRLIRTRKAGRLSERFVRRLVRDLTSGLRFLWERDLIHRDIKPQNLLLTGPVPLEEANDPPARMETEEERRVRAGFASEAFSLKIADFGFARHLAVNNMAETLCGSPLYMAPEILQGQKYDAKADLWSAGTVLFEMIAGKPPFHGENHLDLLRNIQRKAVRLPPDVRASPELVKLLRLLLNRNPLSRAGFREYMNASDAFVALGCGGSASTGVAVVGQGSAVGSDNGAGMQPLRTRMDLCAISENDGGGAGRDSEMNGATSLVTVDTLGTAQPQQLQQPPLPGDVPVRPNDSRGISHVPNMVAAPIQLPSRQDAPRSPRPNRSGVVTPPFQPLPSAPSPPGRGAFLGPSKHHHQQQQQYHHQGRPSVFAPLQASPNVSPSPARPPPPVLTLQDANSTVTRNGDPHRGGTNHPQPRSSHRHFLQQQGGSSGVFPTALPIQRSLMNTNAGNDDGHRRQLPPPSRESCDCDNDFVIVDHHCSGGGSPSSSSHPQGNARTAAAAPLTPTKQNQHYQQPHESRQMFPGDGLEPSPRSSPRPNSSSSSSSRFNILSERSGNVGLLSTSPGTGQALVGYMMGHPPMVPTQAATNALPAPPVAGVGGAAAESKFGVSPRTALRSGGCLAHIENLARMLAAAEDVGRRAITVAHLGDLSAYMAMGRLVAQREERESSPASSSCASMMDGVEEEDCEEDDDVSPFGPFGSRLSKKVSTEDGEDDDDDDEMPFAIPASDDGSTCNEMMSLSPSNNGLSPPALSNNSTTEHTKNKDGAVTSSMIQMHFREALMCYLKTLALMKGSIKAAQKVMNDVEEVIHLPSARPTPINSPYTPIRKRCSISLKWLTGQFAAVMERAEAASDQIAKLRSPPNAPSNEAGMAAAVPVMVCVEELIYNHSLKCGRDGAVKQLLGHYDAARSCYRSAGLLAEALLMEPKLGEEDRAVLEGFVQSFADQISELDGLIWIQRRGSSVRHSSLVHSGQQRRQIGLVVK